MINIIPTNSRLIQLVIQHLKLTADFITSIRLHINHIWIYFKSINGKRKKVNKLQRQWAQLLQLLSGLCPAFALVSCLHKTAMLSVSVEDRAIRKATLSNQLCRCSLAINAQQIFPLN